MFNFFPHVSTAHRALGGNAAGGLQQVPCLADASYDEENLRSDVLEDDKEDVKVSEHVS